MSFIFYLIIKKYSVKNLSITFCTICSCQQVQFQKTSTHLI